MRSSDALSGNTSSTGNPIAAPSMAYAIPVLPEVLSSNVSPGAELPDGESVTHDRQRGPVFHRSAGIRPFRLQPELRGRRQPNSLGEPAQAKKRRIADSLHHRRVAAGNATKDRSKRGRAYIRPLRGRNHAVLHSWATLISEFAIDYFIYCRTSWLRMISSKRKERSNWQRFRIPSLEPRYGDADSIAYGKALDESAAQ